jgi:rhomboid protease GluP
MTLDGSLLLLAILSALVQGVRAGIGRRWRWVGVSLVVLAIAGVGYASIGERAGPIALGAWFVLVAVPGLIVRATTLALHRQRYAWAVRLGWVSFLFFPTRAERQGLERLRVYALLERGDVDEAKRILAGLASRPGPMGLDARLDSARLGERWEELEELLLAIEDSDLAKHPTLVLGVLRGFAELGRRRLLVQFFARHAKRVEPASLTMLRSIALLHVFAFSGRVADVERLLATRLPHLSGELVDLWRALATLFGGGALLEGGADGASRLAKLRDARDWNVRRAARVFLERRALLEADPLEPDEARLVDQLAKLVEQEDRFVVGDSRRTQPRITWVIAVSNVAVFAYAEARGGSTSPEVLFELGALWPASVLEDGEVWRLFAPLFLHFGGLHLAMNLLGLLVLAPFVERALGRARFVAVYVGSGLAGTVLFVAAVHLGLVEPKFLVGASGGIMGMLGATAAVLLTGHRRERALVARRRLFIVLAVLAGQTVFDLVTPQVSLFAHSIGAATGFILAMLLPHGGTRAPSARA